MKGLPDGGYELDWDGLYGHARVCISGLSTSISTRRCLFYLGFLDEGGPGGGERRAALLPSLPRFEMYVDVIIGQFLVT